MAVNANRHATGLSEIVRFYDEEAKISCRNRCVFGMGSTSISCHSARSQRSYCRSASSRRP